MADDPSEPLNSVTPLAPVVRPPASKTASGRALNILLGLAAAIAVGGVAFTIGRATAPVATGPGAFGPGAFANGNGGPGASFAPGASGFPGGQGGFGRGGLTVTGTVESIEGDTITIKTADGSTMTINTNGDTTYHTSTAAAATDVTPGLSVSVRVSGGGAAGGPGASGAPSLTATDVTVDR